FSLVVSDTTKNVKKCRALICKKFPWILNCPDPCHQLNLLAKDLVMKIVNGLTNYFSHSNYGKYNLKEAMKTAKDKRGIEIGGATRFSTFASHAASILRCLPFIEQCFTSGTIPFDTKGLRKFVQPGTDENSKFRLQLNQIGRLLNPISRALKTLEGQNTTPSDIFFIYIGLAVAFQRAFNDPSLSSFYIAHQAESFAAFDRRFKIFMTDCTPGMFILAYLLDPSTVQFFHISDLSDTSFSLFLRLRSEPQSTSTFSAHSGQFSEPCAETHQLRLSNARFGTAAGAGWRGSRRCPIGETAHR
ncbi:hypothetical protein DFH09DRAFT_935685, partial [Mycena vulgaris]